MQRDLHTPGRFLRIGAHVCSWDVWLTTSSQARCSVCLRPHGLRSKSAGYVQAARRKCLAQVAVLVATAEGILYEYAVRNLRAPNGPACALEQESFLLRSDG